MDELGLVTLREELRADCVVAAGALELALARLSLLVGDAQTVAASLRAQCEAFAVQAAQLHGWSLP